MQSVTLPEISIRVAALTDAARLAAFAAQTFRDTYANDNTPENLASHLRSHYGTEQQSRELADRDMTTLLAEHDANLVGYAQLRQHSALPAVTGARPIEILRFYLDQDWQGRGVGQLLMTHVKLEARRIGADSVWLGVWRRNPRAIEFYQKSEFVAIGETTYLVGEDRQSDLVMQCMLEP